MNVVTKTTKIYSDQSGNTPVSAANKNGPTAVSLRTMDIIPEANIAVISLQAFIRHQNHLKIKNQTGTCAKNQQYFK